MRTGYDRFKEKHPELLKAAEHELEIEMAGFNAGVKQCAAGLWVDGEPPRDGKYWLVDCELGGLIVVAWITRKGLTGWHTKRESFLCLKAKSHARINTGAAGEGNPN